MSAEHELAKQWILKARNDLLNADNNLASDVIPTDTVCFHCQQAAEKILKALLVSEGTLPPRTHVLTMLLDMVVPMYPALETLREEIIMLTPYAVHFRYPGDFVEEPSVADAREARNYIRQLWNWVEQSRPDLLPG
jgi:HEPN domain-containing protein